MSPLETVDGWEVGMNLSEDAWVNDGTEDTSSCCCCGLEAGINVPGLRTNPVVTGSGWEGKGLEEEAGSLGPPEWVVGRLPGWVGRPVAPEWVMGRPVAPGWVVGRPVAPG